MHVVHNIELQMCAANLDVYETEQRSGSLNCCINTSPDTIGSDKAKLSMNKATSSNSEDGTCMSVRLVL